ATPSVLGTNHHVDDPARWEHVLAELKRAFLHRDRAGHGVTVERDPHREVLRPDGRVRIAYELPLIAWPRLEAGPRDVRGADKLPDRGPGAEGRLSDDDAPSRHPAWVSRRFSRDAPVIQA